MVDQRIQDRVDEDSDSSIQREQKEETVILEDLGVLPEACDTTESHLHQLTKKLLIATLGSAVEPKCGTLSLPKMFLATYRYWGISFDLGSLRWKLSMVQWPTLI